MRKEMDEKIEIDVGEELENLENLLEKDIEDRAFRSKTGLNCLIYYFERFLEEHKAYEKTKSELANLKCKLKKLNGD